MEGAFGDLWEDTRHWVATHLWLQFGESQHVTAVRWEFAIQEVIHEIDLADDVDEVQGFADEKPERVEIVSAQVLLEIADENFLAVLFAILVHYGHVQVEHEHFDATTFPCLPKVPWYVEEHGLEEQSEAHPLVVFVVLHFVAAFNMAHDTRLYHVAAGHSNHSVRYCERTVNPAICVHDAERDFVNDAVDRIADVLARRHKQREGYQHDNCCFVVKSEYVIVYADLVELQKPFNRAEYIKHIV